MRWKFSRLRPGLGLSLSMSGGLLAGCAAQVDAPTGDLRLDLRHPDPRVRVESALSAVDARRKDLVGALIENLADHDESVRFITGIALKKLTGQDLGYRSYGAPLEREQAVERWRRWHQGAAVGAGTVEPRPPAEKGTPGASGDAP